MQKNQTLKKIIVVNPMSAFLKRFSFHPALFSLYPILALWAANYSVFSITVVIRPIVISLLVLVAAAGLLRIWKLSAIQIGLLLSLSVILFFSYGHVINSLTGPQASGGKTISPDGINLLYAAVWVIGTWAAVRYAKNAEFLNVFLNLTSLALLVLLLQQIFTLEREAWQKDQSIFSQSLANATQQTPVNTTAERPDIYYVILDGYGRDDVLETYLQFDNSAFIQNLQARGFTVAKNSTSNYSNTTTSLSSSLNFHYINELSAIMGPDSGNYRPMGNLIRHNQIMTFLERYHYTTVAFETGFPLTEMVNADYYINVQARPNNFETLLLLDSLSRLVAQDAYTQQYQYRIPAVLEKAAHLSEIPSPKYVFVHVMAAHSPYVFGSHGEIRKKATQFQVHEVNPNTRADEMKSYGEQVTYVNTLVLAMVDEILKNAAQNTIIVIQGDHGSDIYMDGHSVQNSCFAERKSILNAYYFPGGKTALLYDSITPVNSFRVIFNTYFDANFPLLEDRNYFSLPAKPYDFTDVTGLQGKCP